ncbi:MAG: DUF393 domain-containing protein [Gammaproteobacteria bacterium]|nr:DUF393 domain-containing protein [Gammaproteobacteria bacterium]MDH5800422.1 DUF393 domain-containing protein [Gammaproteobacteria bacterium]
MMHKVPGWAFFKNLKFSNYRNYKNQEQNAISAGPNRNVVLYDHECPLCRREMLRLKSLDKDGRLELININGPSFREKDWGVSHAQVSEAMHVLTGEGIWLVGMPAIRYVYAQVGHGWYMVPSGWPVLSRLADLAYGAIAKNRYFVSKWLGFRTKQSHYIDTQCPTDQCTDFAQLTNHQAPKSSAQDSFKRNEGTKR